MAGKQQKQSARCALRLGGYEWGNRVIEDSQQGLYFYLVDTLLRHPTEIRRTLSQHQDLLNLDLLQVIELMAATYLEREQGQIAGELDDIAELIAASILVRSRSAPHSSQQNTPAEQRRQEYIQVVQDLLIFPYDKSQAVLQHHRQCLDFGLVQVLLQVATLLRQQQQEIDAIWLEVVAMDLGHIPSSQITAPSELRSILEELPWHPHSSQDMARRVELWRRALRLISPQENEQTWRIFQLELGNSLRKNLLGDRAQNIEEAITAYQQALQVTPRQAMPVEWAGTMNNLAMAYSDRIRGDRAQNIEEAIASYQQALQVVNRWAMPVEWTRIMNNLASAYRYRIRGDRAQNIEEAITTYKQALKVRTREAMPIEWAETMNNLANAYRRRIRGNRAQNIEEAITAYKQALQVTTRQAKPVQWAELMNNLAIAYSERIRGDRAQTIEESIAVYKQSLQVRTREAMPIEWAGTMNNLASAYHSRILGDRAQNIENAIATYKQALQVTTRQAMPVEWAESMNNLANAYLDRIRGDRAQNIEEAIAAYKQSLQVRTREALPVEWATSVDHLAEAYCSRILGDRAQNIEETIVLCKQSLQVRTREALPIQWAGTMTNLAAAYRERIFGDRVQNIEAAILAYSQALEIYTLEDYPDYCRLITYQLANLYAEQTHWDEARLNYFKALTAAENLYQSALSRSSQEAELSEINDLYHRAAYAYAKVGDLETAVTTIEQGRARSLSETLQRDRVDLDAIYQINPDLADRYQTAANTIRQLEATERRTSLDRNQLQYSPEKFRNQATQARQVLQTCITEIRQIPGYESFLTLPTFADIAATLQVEQPLVYLLHTPNGSLALVVTTHGIADLWLPDLTDDKLIDLLNTTWFAAYNRARNDRQGWLNTIDQVTHQLWEKVMAPLVNHLQQQHVQQAILIPAGYLSFLPLHAAWTEDATRPTGRRYACDEIQFTYAPNALSLKAARAVAARTHATQLLAINEPLPVSSRALPSASFEAAKAVSAFPGKGNWKILQHEDASRNAVLEALPHCSVAHFACHGLANFRTPLDSGLLMADDQTLSLRDLLDLKLQGLRLAILSACETGIPGTELPDEVVSLSTGLLQAGAAGIVSSLWSVADLSTMLLLSRFYDLWRPSDPHVAPVEPSTAWLQAQRWLRDSTGPELAPYLQASHPELAAKLEQLPNKRPFAHPFYWAAFTYVGV